MCLPKILCFSLYFLMKLKNQEFLGVGKKLLITELKYGFDLYDLS